MASAKSPAIEGELYFLLRQRLPICRAANGSLDVSSLAWRLQMTSEGIYRWLRANQVSRAGRRKLIAVSHDPDNVEALRGLQPLSPQDLYPFC